MARPTLGSLKPVLFATLLLCWCTPLRDLDSAASGRAGAGGAVAGAGGIAKAGGAGGAGGGSGGTSVDAAAGGSVGIDAATGGSLPVDVGAGGTAGAVVGTGGISTGGTGSAGAAGTGGAISTGGTSGGPAPDLPDITSSPVQGSITYSAGASWDIDGTQWPAFEIHTPTASYWLVKSAAAIVSITDSSGLQWINFSSGFRPNRGVPNLGGCCQPGNPAKLGLPTMTTEVDPTFTVNSSHLRLISKATDESYWLVWDFFLTHFTLTINRAQAPFGFTFRGSPGGSIAAADQLGLSGGTPRSANSPFSGDLPGPAEWAYLSHPAVSHSLFLIQHTGDDLPETYQIADLDTPMFTFGSGQITQTPMRFSLGLVNSCDDQTVRDRITFVSSAIH